MNEVVDDFYGEMFAIASELSGKSFKPSDKEDGETPPEGSVKLAGPSPRASKPSTRKRK